MELDPKQQADQDRRMIVAMGLTALVVFGYYNFFAPPPPPPGSERVTAAESTPGQSTPTPGLAASPEVVASTVAPSAPLRTVERSWEGVRSTWSSVGGSPSAFYLEDYVAQEETPPWLPTWLLGKVTGKSEDAFHMTCATEEVDGLVDVIRGDSGVALPVGIDSSGIAADTASYELVEEGPRKVVFSTLRDGVEISKAYELPTIGYVTGYTVTLRNAGPNPREVLPSFGVVDYMPEAESRYGPKVETHASIDEDHETADEEKLRKKQDDPPMFTGPVDWWAVGDKYFLLGLEPDEPMEGTASFTVIDAEAGRFASKVTLAPKSLAPGESVSYHFRLWSGPKVLGGLEDAKMKMSASVDFGVFGLVAIPILYFLKFLYGVFGSFGVSILVLTFAVKLLLFPLTQKQYRSMKDMQDLNPEITALRERLKDDKDALNKEMMKLFSERGVNPMGGCLPMIVQMPIWFALYRVLWMSADLYQAPWLYLCDLTMQDPLGLLPLIYTVSMYITTKMNQSPTTDPAQQRIMTLMPVVFGFIMFTLPAGLVLYMVVNNALSIGQQWVIKRGIGNKPVAAKA